MTESKGEIKREVVASRLSLVERGHLRVLCRINSGITESEMLRQLIHEAYASLMYETKPAA